LFYEGATPLGDEIQVLREENMVWYFVNGSPVNSHTVDDVASFRAITSSFCDHGLCRLVDVERAFAVSAISVKRALKQYRSRGTRSFYVKQKASRSAPVWTSKRLVEAQRLIDDGLTNREVGQRLSIKRDTVYRAVKDGRLRREPQSVESKKKMTEALRKQRPR
jgi:hypothetical protein